MKKLLAYQCPKCQSTEIDFEGWIRFDKTTQQFEVIEVCDKGHKCCDCEEAGSIDHFLVSSGAEKAA